MNHRCDYTRPGVEPYWDDETTTCGHSWLDRPESDSRECLICGTEAFG